MNEGRAVSGVSGRQTYTLESIVAGVLEVEGIHVVYLRHVFLPLFELFLVSKDREGTEGARGGPWGGRRRAFGSGFPRHGSDLDPLDMDGGGDEGGRGKVDRVTDRDRSSWSFPHHHG